MQQVYGIYYNDHLLYVSCEKVRNTSTIWHHEWIKARDQVCKQLGIQQHDFDNSLYKIKKIEVTPEVKIESLLKGMKASDIQLLKEYFKRDQNALV